MKNIYSRISDEEYQNIKEKSKLSVYNFTQQAIAEKLKKLDSKEVTADEIKRLLEVAIGTFLQSENRQKNILDEIQEIDKKYREDTRGAILKILSNISDLKHTVGEKNG